MGPNHQKSKLEIKVADTAHCSNVQYAQLMIEVARSNLTFPTFFEQLSVEGYD